MKKINYKSDFDLIVRLKDCEGTEVPWPECDWDATFWTSGMASYAASYKAATGEYKNCFREADGSMHFVFDSHGLGIGELKWQPHFALENPVYADGYKDTFSRAALDIELVVVGEDCPNEVAEALVVIPWQYLHDTDVYNEILEQVNGILEDVLGEGGAPIPSSKGGGVGGQFVLHKGILNLRDTNNTVCCAKFRDFYLDSEPHPTVKLVISGDEYDLSEWFADGDVVDVFNLDYSKRVEGIPSCRVTLDGLTIKIDGDEGFDDRVAVAIRLRDDYFKDSQYIRMSGGRPVGVSSATEYALPRISFEDAVKILKTHPDDGSEINEGRINGQRYQIQRRRANSHYYDEDERGGHEKHRKWRTWKKFYRRNPKSNNILVYRVRYKSYRGHVGPWTYISKRKDNYDEI